MMKTTSQVKSHYTISMPSSHIVLPTADGMIKARQKPWIKMTISVFLGCELTHTEASCRFTNTSNNLSKCPTQLDWSPPYLLADKEPETGLAVRPQAPDTLDAICDLTVLDAPICTPDDDIKSRWTSTMQTQSKGQVCHMSSFHHTGLHEWECSVHDVPVCNAHK